MLLITDWDCSALSTVPLAAARDVWSAALLDIPGAPAPQNPTSTGTVDVTYPLKDALGSTYAVVDANGTVQERDYFDSWGLRSNPDGTALANLSLFHSLGTAGFTQHEHDDDLGLINMQGRIYDPALGRFLSPDPLVGNDAFSESWNGYSYVLNSPLNFTDPSGFDPCPPGLFCTTGPGNEITNTIQSQYGNETFGGGDSGGIGASGVGAAQSMISGTFAYIQDMAELKRQQHEVDVRAGRVLPDGTRIRAADGTPILPRRYNSQNQLVDNWGKIRIYPNSIAENPQLNYTDNRAVKYVGNFATRLFCGSKCGEASAPTSARETAQAPKQLSSARIARNTVSQALAARALVKFLGKVGVVIDEGVDGIIDRLMPEGMGMGDHDRKFARILKKEMAAKRYEDAQQRVAAAMEKANQSRERVQNAFEDLDNTAPLVTDELGFEVYATNLKEHEKAQNALEAALKEEEHALNLQLGLDDE